MGMSASQARYLGLIARQSNLEYQGQQINQERSILSQQCTALYNSLLAMNVPTPPSTNDFTTIEYSGNDGATKFTLGTIKPNGASHTVEICTEATGHSLAVQYNTATVSKADGTIKGDLYTPAENATTATISGFYVLEANGGIRRATEADFDKDEASGEFKFKAGVDYVQASPNGTEWTNNEASQTEIAGQPAMTWGEAQTKYPDLDWSNYEAAIRNKFGTDKNISKDSFLVYVTTSKSGVQEPHFAFADDVQSADKRATVYDYSPNGKYTESKITEGCGLTFDTSGRITAIDIPVIDEETGEITAYNTVSLEATQKTDELAYQDAYAKYEYAQYEYDKAQQEINAKTEVIQQEDRNLELKLTRLDNERTQITTEIEAVEKVINDNIEKSYKTFSG